MLKYDEEGFIVGYEGNESVITIPGNISGIKAFAFFDLDVKEIIFEKFTGDVIIEEDSFVALSKLEVVNCSAMTVKSIKLLMKSFSACAEDICFILGKYVTPRFYKYLTDEYSNNYCLFRESSFVDLSKFEGKKDGDEFILYGIKDSSFTWGEEVFFPDYYDGLKVVLDISTQEFQEYLANKILKEAIFVKFPIVIDSKGFNLTSFKNTRIKNIHISRLQTEIPKTFLFQALKISRIYIPENIKVFGGFDSCENISEVIFEDSSTITRVHSNTLSGSLLQKECFKNENVFYLAGMALACNYKVKDLARLYFRKGTRVIADFFANGVMDFEKVVFPDSLEYIGQKAFYNCTKFNINITKNVKFIGEEAFCFEYWENDEKPQRDITFENRHFDSKLFEGTELELPFG